MNAVAGYLLCSVYRQASSSFCAGFVPKVGGHGPPSLSVFCTSHQFTCSFALFHDIVYQLSSRSALASFSIELSF